MIRREGCRWSRGRRCDGFTLVEGVFTSVIAALIFTVLFELHTTSSDVMHSINAQGVVQMELSRAADALERDAALAAAAPASFGAYAAPPDLILQVPSIDANGEVITGMDHIIYTFDAEAGALTRVVAPGAGSARAADTHVVARYVTAFSAPVSAEEVTFTFNGQHAEADEHPFALQLAGRVRFRNAQN